MSLAFAKKHGFKLIDSNIHIKTASNEIVKVSGTTEFLDIKIRHSKCKLKFLVINNSSQDILLGLDWFNLTDCVISPSEKWLKLSDNSLKIPLFDLNSESDNSADILISESGDLSDIDDDADWMVEDRFKAPDSIQPLSILSASENALFAKFRQSLKGTFATDYDNLGCCNLRKHKIKIIDPDLDPLFIPPYRKSPAERAELKLEIEKMLKAGVIRRSRSPYSSPAFMVPKKCGKRRLVIDYRQLNKRTRTEYFPLPNITDIIERVACDRYFTSLDLKAGYWQVLLDEGSVALTAFSTPDGHYEFLRLPFGLKNAPADFSRLMREIIGDLEFVECYIDDLIVHSADFKSHLKHISQVLDRLSGANLKINLEKCVWLGLEIKVLGYIISHNKIMMDPAKVEAIANCLAPTNIRELQRFVGCCNYYSKFVKDFALIVKPLFDLTKKDTKYVWSELAELGFVQLKELLLQYPILRQPDPSQPFIIHCDSSGYASGAILSQVDPESGLEYVVVYASRILKGAETHYTITEKECLAVVWSVKLFRPYIYGSKFTVITDHEALKWLMGLKNPVGRLARWVIYLQCLDFEIIHKKGSSHTNADFLSRPVLANKVAILPDNPDDISSVDSDIFEDEPFIYFLLNGRHRDGISRKVLNRINKLSPYYKYDGVNILYDRHGDSKF
jgi:hypothetical protein